MTIYMPSVPYPFTQEPKLKYKPKYCSEVKPLTLNIEKMRKQQARNTPDSVWRTFDFDDKYDYTHGYDQWRIHWVRMMQIKHKGRPMKLEIFQTNPYEQPGRIRVQMVATLRRPDGELRAGGADVSSDTLASQIYSQSEVRTFLGMEPSGCWS